MRRPLPRQIIALVAALGVAGVARAAVVDRIAAVVDDEVITLSEVYDLGSAFIDQRCSEPGVLSSCRLEAELEVLDSLILRALIRQELERLGLGVTGAEVDRTIDSIASDNGYEGRDELRQAVEATGMRWDTYREQLNEQLQQMKFTEQIIRPRITVSDDELVDFYKRSVRDYSGPPLIKLEATIIPIPADPTPEELGELTELAATVAAEVAAGTREWSVAAEPFEGAIQQPMGSQAVRVTDLAPSLAMAVESVDQGGVAGPVRMGDNLLLLRVVERAESDVLPFEEVEDQILDQLYERKTDEAIEQWYQQARRKAAVRVLLEAT